jgi:hypothetical protein
MCLLKAAINIRANARVWLVVDRDHLRGSSFLRFIVIDRYKANWKTSLEVLLFPLESVGLS